jgi:hypothetical protein
MAAGPETQQPSDSAAVVNQGACDVEGKVGYSPEHVAFTCRRFGDGTLRWAKRY